MITILIIAFIVMFGVLFSFQLSLMHRILFFHFKLFVDDGDGGGINQIKTTENKNTFEQIFSTEM